MSNAKKNNLLEIIGMIVATILVFAFIKNLFDNDESKIVSEEGRDYLSDKEKMKELQRRLEEVDKDPNKSGDIIVV